MYITKEEYIEMTKDLDFDELEKDLSEIWSTTSKDLGLSDVEGLRSFLKKQKVERIMGHVLIMGSLDPLSYLAGILLMTASKCRDGIAHEALHRCWDQDCLAQYLTESERERVSADTADWRSWTIPSEGWKHGHNRKHHPNTGLEFSDPDALYGGCIDPETGKAINEGSVGLYGAFLKSYEGAPDVELSPEIWGSSVGNGKNIFAKIGYKSRYLIMAVLWTHLMGFHHANSFDSREKREESTKDVLYRIVLRYSEDLGTAALNPLNLIFGMPMYIKTALGYLASTVLLNMVESTFIWQGHHANECMILDEKIGDAQSLGEWYYRQIICTNDFTSEIPFLAKCYRAYGCGLDAQTVHHLFPLLPHTRFDQVRKEVMKVCNKHKIKYNIGPVIAGFQSVLSRFKKNHS